MDQENSALIREKILDHGYVELIEILGSDQAIINAARTSYDKGTRKVSTTRQLIRYLMRHRHMGPFEFGAAVFRIRCPLFVARQWFRHRTGSYNEASLRYSEARDEYYLPQLEWITTQDGRNRQARTTHEIEEAGAIRNQMDKEAKAVLDSYNSYIEKGVAREIARINLPLSYYTTFCFKSDIRNLMNFFSLRTDSHAQFEIRLYADIMVKMIAQYFPLTVEAWEDYHRNSIQFSAQELKIFQSVLKINDFDLLEKTQKYIDEFESELNMAKLEIKELVDKILLLYGKESTLDYLGKI
jgi:thymidylate synthase (FAD)